MASSGKLVPPRRSFSLQKASFVVIVHFNDYERKGQGKLPKIYSLE